MFQIVGSFLALATVIATLAAAPLYGLAFAVGTLVWVVKAKPAQAGIQHDALQGGVVVVLGQFR